jgi:hypothetical protein
MISAFLTAEYTTVSNSVKGTFDGTIYTTPKGKKFAIIGYFVSNGNGGYNYISI